MTEDTFLVKRPEVDITPFAPERENPLIARIRQELAQLDDKGKARQLLERALKLAEGIEDPSDRAKALRSIAPELAKMDVAVAKQLFEQALAMADGIEDEDGGWKASTLGHIASELAKVDVEKALQVVEGIEDEHYKAETLGNISPELAKVNVERAVTIADSLDSLIYQVTALIGIARVLLDGKRRRINHD